MRTIIKNFRECKSLGDKIGFGTMILLTVAVSPIMMLLIDPIAKVMDKLDSEYCDD